MQKYILIYVVIFSVVFGCTQNSGPINGNSIQPNNKLDTLVAMSASINSHYFYTDSAFGYNVRPLKNDSTNSMNLLINASATKQDSINSISLQINNYTGPGTYNINPPTVAGAWYLNNQRHYAIFGQITVLSDTAYALIGTFSFIADSIIVNKGQFNVLMPY